MSLGMQQYISFIRVALVPLPKLQRGKLIPNSEALIVGNMIGIYCLAIEVSIILGDGCLFVI